MARADSTGFTRGKQHYHWQRQIRHTTRHIPTLLPRLDSEQQIRITNVGCEEEVCSRGSYWEEGCEEGIGSQEGKTVLPELWYVSPRDE